MGNYQFTLFSHISGEYELITGQRSWGRMNFGKKPNSGNNQCKITISNPSSNQNQTYNLVGINSLSGNEEICKRKFGIGYAKYEYSLDEVEISRSLHIKPSANIDGGSPAFIVTFEIKNTSKNTTAYADGINRLPSNNALVMYTDKGPANNYSNEKSNHTAIQSGNTESNKTCFTVNNSPQNNSQTIVHAQENHSNPISIKIFYNNNQKNPIE